MTTPNTTNTTTDQKFHPAQFVGALVALLSAAGLVIAIVLPASFRSFVQTCAATQNNPATYSVGGSAECSIKTFIVDYQIVFIIGLAICVAGGLMLMFFGNHKEVREELGAE